MRSAQSQDFEVAIGPHPARPDWRVLRVTYAPNPEHDARIAAALLAILMSPRQGENAGGQRETVDAAPA